MAAKYPDPAETTEEPQLKDVPTILAEVREKDPGFRTKKLDVASLKPRYPDFVVVIGEGGDDIPCKARVRCWEAALDLVDCASFTDQKFTLVFVGGVFFDFPLSIFSYKAELEIVGLNEVVFVVDTRIGLIIVREKPLTLRNVYVIDRSPVHKDTGTVTTNGEVRFDGVMFHASRNGFLFVVDGSAVDLRRCRVVASPFAFNAVDGARLTVSDSVISHCLWWTGLATRGARVSLNGVNVASSPGMKFSGPGTVVDVENCDIVGPLVVPTADRGCNQDDLTGISVHDEARVTVTRCRLSRFMFGIAANGTGVKTVVRESKIEESLYAFFAGMNSSWEILDNAVGAKCFMRLFCNVRGEFVVRRNRGSKKSVLIEKDDVSKMPELHFGNVKVRKTPKGSVDFMDQKLRSEVTQMYRSDPSSIEALGHVGIKSCGKCLKVEKLGEKLKYCSHCKQACYCSKACQKADWKDHKLMCPLLIDQ